VFTTLSRATTQKTTPLSLTARATATSFIAATVGSKLEEACATALAKEETAQAYLLTALRDEALHQSIQFIIKLIAEQAKEEECELSALSQAEEASLLPPLAALLGIQRIGLECDENAPALPPYSRLMWTQWTPVAKSSRRGDASAHRSAAAV
jgi:hypothetical protein